MNKPYLFFSMNRNIAGACHLAFVAFLFLSPLTYWRGTGFNAAHYLMTCMNPLFLMIVFYLNYIYLAPKLFVSGKHRYDLLINVVMLITLGVTLHYWMVYTNSIFVPNAKDIDTVGTISYIARDTLNLAIFAAGATALAVARRWVTTEQKLKETEAARAKAELTNMRNQINPHFLLNTLNNIYALIAFDPDKAQTAVGELSKLLRHALYDNQKKFVPLYKEVEFIQNYIDLMKIRVTDNVKITDDIDISDDDSTPIAPLIFISLIENAFKHGVSQSGAGNISIKLNNKDDKITCEIRNTNYPKHDNDKSGSGIGLEQVAKRLELMYKDHYTWKKGVDPATNEYYSIIILDNDNKVRNK